ncbi:MAG: hypothetical protein KJ799_04185 [Bacteroidetes bacterium]|nr:hypothetical protein [Bacteroidota bacterium]MBU2505906.1 hypothetical protein [Bacteroidota bacterium]
MAIISHQERVDKIISQFWQDGYLTLSRKFGTYLPNPDPINSFEVDAVGKFKKKVAIGIVVKDEDFQDNRLIEKIKYLTAANSNQPKRSRTLILSVSRERLTDLGILIASLPLENQKQIKIIAQD